ncbi:hypothetical protein T492DRAFT_93846 [Pavlovales sp. CCMP2436]|nr:hypothetical protein T492DRAFT_93846 [Pavlovales sp. CCMP2436]
MAQSHPGGSRGCEQAARGLWWRQRRAGCTVPAALALALILVHTALSGTRRTAGALLAQDIAAESAGGRAMDVDELYFFVVGDWGVPCERPEMNSSRDAVPADSHDAHHHRCARRRLPRRRRRCGGRSRARSRARRRGPAARGVCGARARSIKRRLDA